MAELNARTAASKAKSAELAEQKRRADCYPDLLAALQLLFKDKGEDRIRSTSWDQARAAISKATGVKP